MPDGGLGGIRWGNQRYFRELWLAAKPALPVSMARVEGTRSVEVLSVVPQASDMTYNGGRSPDASVNLVNCGAMLGSTCADAR